MKFIFLLFFVCMNLVYGFDSIEVLNPNITVHRSGYFKTDETLSSEQALSQHFKPLPEKAISFGFDHDTYWFLFEVSTTCKEQYYLDSKDILGNYQDLYIYRDGKLLRHDKNGFYLPLEEKTLKIFSSRFKLESTEQKTIYLLKIDSIFMRLASFAFGNEKEVEKSWAILLNILIATGSIACAFLLYNLLLYFYIKDKLFIYYCIYMFGFVLVNQLSLGYLPFLLGFDGKSAMTLWIFAMVTYTCGLTFFTINFLDLKEKHHNLKNIFIILLIINITLTPFHILTGVFPYSQHLWLLSVQLFQFFTIFLVVKRYFEGFKPALFYLIATGGGLIFSFGFVILIGNSGIYYSLLTLNLPNLALIWDLIFFSLALAYRIRLLREENTKNERLAIMKSRQKVIGELIGNIAHQWRQPLNIIGSIISNLEAKTKYDHLTTDELLESCKLSNSVLHHLSGTINTLQDFFIDETDKKEKFDLNEHIKYLINFLQESMSNQNITIQFLPEKALFIDSNQNLLSQVIMNIFLNAKDILIERNIGKDKIITITTELKYEKIIINISDNGGGIRIEPINRVFELFISEKSNGSGVGLYLSKNIIEKLHGQLLVSNTKYGAQFTIILPK